MSSDRRVSDVRFRTLTAFSSKLKLTTAYQKVASSGLATRYSAYRSPNLLRQANLASNRVQTRAACENLEVGTSFRFPAADRQVSDSKPFQLLRVVRAGQSPVLSLNLLLRLSPVDTQLASYFAVTRVEVQHAGIAESGMPCLSLGVAFAELPVARSNPLLSWKVHSLQSAFQFPLPADAASKMKVPLTALSSLVIEFPLNASKDSEHRF